MIILSILILSIVVIREMIRNENKRVMESEDYDDYDDDISY